MVDLTPAEAGICLLAIVKAEQFGWNDLACGSCGRAFRGYPWPPKSTGLEE